MRHSRLSEYTFKKGEFITPINSIPKMHELPDEQSWVYGRMPEYLWMGLLLRHLGRKEGLKKISWVLRKLHQLAPELRTARISQIIKLDNNSQKHFYESIFAIAPKEVLAPLTIVLTLSKSPIFAEYFYCRGSEADVRCNTLTETMRGIMNHQSNEATDIRFLALYFSMLSGKVHILKENADLLNAYPVSDHAEEIMRLARPAVRTMEMMTLTINSIDSEFLTFFWRRVSEMTECTVFAVEFPEEKRNLAAYMEKLHEVFSYLSELYISVNPLDEKMMVLLGIATYSYKRLKEIYDHNLFNSVSGRGCVRVLIEDYIMIKYLVKNEPLHENIWRDYQLYGLGAYKLILAKYRENGGSKQSHFDEQYIEALVNEFKAEEFINMDTRYFDKQNIRQKADNVDEKMLYGLYYDYDSSFEHGLWGAVRESALLKCDNPAHKYHCIPDVDDQKRLKSVLPDCVMVMNKTLRYIDELYGIPEQLLNEVINFEIESVDE